MNQEMNELVFGVGKVHPSLMDVQVLMAVQLLIEFARDFPDQSLLQNIYQHILFDMRIWCRSQFHVRIGKPFKTSSTNLTLTFVLVSKLKCQVTCSTCRTWCERIAITFVRSTDRSTSSTWWSSTTVIARLQKWVWRIGKRCVKRCWISSKCIFTRI